MFKSWKRKGEKKVEFASDKPLKLASVDLRDGQQSLLGTRVKIEDFEPILGKLDQAGFACAEVWGGATFDVCLRYLNENPWDRLRKIKSMMPKTPLRMLLRGQNLLGYGQYPDDVVESFIAKSAEAGMDIFLIFDILGDIRNVETAVRAVQKAGKIAHGELSYGTGEVYTLDFYAKKAQEYESLGVEAITVEDGSGILTPQDAFNLIKTLKGAVKVPVHLHCHSTGGLAPLAYWEAIKAGVDAVDTDLSAFSNGTAHPATESFVLALQDTPRATGMDLNLLREINEHLVNVRSKYKEFESSFTGIDTSVFQHEVPGGMLSNLELQLKQMNAEDRIKDVLKEVAVVRKDFGFPMLGTPLAQIIGVQATMNVLSGEKYKMVTKESRNYVKGMYGLPPGEINPEVSKKILGNEEKITCRPADLIEPALDKSRAALGSLAESEEDVISYALFPEVTRSFLEKKNEISFNGDYV